MSTKQHACKANYEAKARLWRMHAVRLRSKIDDCIKQGADPDSEHVQILNVWAENAEHAARYYQRKADALNG